MRGYRNTPESFWDRLDKAGDCWVWTGALYVNGYGAVRWGGKKVYTHRLAFELNSGPIPEGLFVCHRCDNPPCCNPAHLFLATPRENMVDRDAKGRHGWARRPDAIPRGEQSLRSVLTLAQVEDARRSHAHGESVQSIATRLKRSYKTIHAALTGENWRHAGGPIRQPKYRRRCA